MQTEDDPGGKRTSVTNCATNQFLRDANRGLDVHSPGGGDGQHKLGLVNNYVTSGTSG